MKFVEIQWQSSLYEDEIKLRDQLLRAPLGLVFSEEDLQQESKQFHFGILDQSTLIACVVIVPLSPADAKLRQMAVAATHQRQGVGSNLIHNIESELQRRKFRMIELNARDVAVGFYEKLGYRKQGEEFIEVTIPHWKMIKPIGPASVERVRNQ